MSWFSGRMKPSKIVMKAINALKSFSKPDDPKHEESITTIDKNFGRMTDILYKKKEGVEAGTRALHLVKEITGSEFIQLGLKNLQGLPVEQRKQFTIIFTGSINHQSDEGYPLVDWLKHHFDTLDTLLSFYDFPDLAACAGEMLRLCIKQEDLASYLLQQSKIDKLSTYFTVSHFDVSADSFATFRELVLVAPQSAQYVEKESQFILSRLIPTFDDSNYASCRQSLKLINELIGKYPSFRQTFLNDEKNLKSMMELMLSSYKNISMEAFALFRLFIESNTKTEPITKIISQNATPLSQLIHSLLDSNDSPEVQEIKNQLINTIENLAKS